jgi:phosphate transport system permease protein
MALMACGLISVLTTLGIVLALISETLSFFREVSPLEYFTGREWAPTFGRNASFGVLPLISGTLKVTAIAVMFSVPLGLATAIYLSEYAPGRVRGFLKPFLEVLAGIPTVVLGFFALNFVTKNLLEPAIPEVERFNVLSAGLVVGLMIIPTIASLSEDALRAVPGSLREGAYALGATRRIAALKVIVPAALSGIAASVILGMSRAVGETMIVAIAGGNQPSMSFNPLKGSQTMTAYIVQVSLGDTATGEIAYQTIFAVGTTLFVLTLILNLISIRIVRRFRETYE